jgi:hypothetical protein
MAALRSVYRPPLPYQSLSTSTSWAVDSFDRDFPGDPNGRLIHTGQQLTGARFPNGRVEAVEASHFANLMVARAMVNRETVNEYHVNLESPAGRMVKQQMGLPFQDHSRVDPIRAAEQADDTYGMSGKREGNIFHSPAAYSLAAGMAGVLGVVGHAGHVLHVMEMLGEQPEEEAHALKAFGPGKIFGGSAKQEMDLSQEMINGVHVYRGFDSNSAFKEQAVTRLAEAEIWAHGSLKGQDWHLLGAAKTAQPTADVVRQVIQQEKVGSVLIDSCNAARSVIPTPQGATVTYGLGYGVASNQQREGMGAVRSWLDAVVVSEGDTAKIYSKSAVQAELGRRGLDPRGLPTNKLRTVKGDFLEGDTSTLGVFKTAAGETRLTAHPVGQSAGEVMKYSMALDEAPSITLRHGKGGPTFEVGSKSFSSFEEASSSLTQSIRAKTQASAGVNHLLQSAGISSVKSADLDEIAQLRAKAAHFREKGMIAAAEAREAKAAALEQGGKVGAVPLTTAADLHAAAQAPAPPAAPPAPAAAKPPVEPVTAPPPKAALVTDSPVQAASRVAQNVEKESQAAFHGPVLMGILAAGALAVGGLMLHHHDHPATAGSTSNQHSPHEPRHRKHEQNETATQTERRPGGNPRSNTKIRLTDADLNMDEVDRMFAHHFKRGYAYS